MKIPMAGNSVSYRRVWIARCIAVAVDAVQIGALPLFSEGFLSPLDMGLDVVTAAVMIALLGWHIAFVPTFIVESLPFADLAPSWTIAVLIVTRKTPLNPAKAGTAEVANPGRLV
jgi:hypothetical protein